MYARTLWWKATNQSKSQADLFLLMNCKIMNKASEWMDCTSSLMYSNKNGYFLCHGWKIFFPFLLRFCNEKWMKRTEKVFLGNGAEV